MSTHSQDESRGDRDFEQLLEAAMLGELDPTDRRLQEAARRCGREAELADARRLVEQLGCERALQCATMLPPEPSEEADPDYQRLLVAGACAETALRTLSAPPAIPVRRVERRVWGGPRLWAAAALVLVGLTAAFAAGLFTGSDRPRDEVLGHGPVSTVLFRPGLSGRVIPWESLPGPGPMMPRSSMPAVAWSRRVRTRQHGAPVGS